MSVWKVHFLREYQFSIGLDFAFSTRRRGGIELYEVNMRLPRCQSDLKRYELSLQKTFDKRQNTKDKRQKLNDLKFLKFFGEFM